MVSVKGSVVGLATLACLIFGVPTASAQTDSRVVGSRKAKAEKPLTKAQKKVARDMKYASFLLLIEKDYEAAATQYASIVKKNKKNIEAHMGLVSAQAKRNDWKAVVSALKKLTKVAPRDRAVWAALGDAHIKAGSTDDAFTAYEKALSLDPNYPPALLAMGDRAYRTFVKDKSDANKATVIDLYGRYLQGTKTRKGRTAARVRRVVAELKDGPAAAAFLDGENLYNKAFNSRFGIGRAFEKSYAKMEHVLKDNPKHQDALYYQGLMHVSVKSKKLHDVTRGIAKFKAAGEHAPSLTELGRLARRDDDLELATQYLVQAHTIDSKNQKTAYELGLVHKLAGRRDKAVDAFDTAVDIDPRSDIGSKAVVELSILAPKNRRVFTHFRRSGRFKGDIFNTEKFKGSISSLEARLGGVDEMAPEQEWLDEMMRKLLAAGEVSPQQVFTVKVVKTKKINAFAVPNGNLYFTRGFLKLAKETFPELPMDVNHHAIASVMGHEITHVTKEHVIRSFVFKDAMNSGPMKPSTLVSVTRTHEIEADREGMKLMFLAGYDPTYAVKMFEAYAAKLGEVPSGLDHPTFDERIHYLEEYWSNEMSFAYSSFHSAVKRIEEAAAIEGKDLNKAAAMYKESIDDLKRFMVAFRPTKEALNNLALANAKLGLFELSKSDPKGPINRWFTEFSVEPSLALKFVPLAKARKTRGGGGGKTQIPASLRQARTYLKKALKRDPAYTRARLNLGVVYLASGDYDAADKQLAELRKRCENACDVDLGRVDNLIGIAHAERGRIKVAIAHFEQSVKAIKPGQAAPPRIFNLARALDEDGDKEEAAKVYQQFLDQVGDSATTGFAVHARDALARLK